MLHELVKIFCWKISRGFLLLTHWLHLVCSHRPGQNTQNAPQDYSTERNRAGSMHERFQGCRNRSSLFDVDVARSCFSPTYLQVAVAHGTVSCPQVIVHTLPKAVQTGGIRGAAGLSTRWGLQQQTAWTGGVLARALARALLQRHGSTERQSQIYVNLEKKEKKMKGLLSSPSVTWQSRCQTGGPDRIPWCTLADTSLDPMVQSLHKQKHRRGEWCTSWESVFTSEQQQSVKTLSHLNRILYQ